MPRIILPLPDDDRVIDLETLIDWCESPLFDPECEDGLAQAAPMLHALARNRHFLADLAIAELKTRCADQRRSNPYGAQVLLLSPPSGRYMVRAAFWPAMRDHVVRSSGAEAFFYHVPHDHGFDFLTVGYLGPGYASDHYEYDGGQVAGFAGEPVTLRHSGRSTLGEGVMHLYRANRDIHAQLPAPSLSVSLNLLGRRPDQGWRRQYRFDLAKAAIARCMTVSSAQMLIELAVGCGNGIDLAHEFAAGHPVDAMRLTAWRALLDQELDAKARATHLASGAVSDSPLICADSRRMLRQYP